MNVLLVYPQYPDTFWSFKHALKFVSKKAVNPPLGLITVAAMLPDGWSKKLIDLNIESITARDILWADLVFVSAMSVQFNSVHELINKCHDLDRKVVAGGPLFTEDIEGFPKVDYFVLNEAELTIPQFLHDLKNRVPKRIYKTDQFADIRFTPIPDYSLVRISEYDTLNLQYTRGCPFNCEFCDIKALFGNKTRAKTPEQIIHELDAIYDTGWRKTIFFVDDNFIGNKRKLKNELLPALIEWMENKKRPFSFTTEASINLSDDEELMELMTRAGFSSVFIGIETTELSSLSECGKSQNINRNLVQSVIKIQNKGMEVAGGFILGFDSDSAGVFDKQIEFIRESGIISAMVGLLNAPKRTSLYKRLKKEGRILTETSGNNTDFTLNFVPKMDKQILMAGYKKVIQGIYGGKEYYQRVLDFIKRFTPNDQRKERISSLHLLAFFKVIFKLGLFDAYRTEYWRLFFWTLRNRPKLVPLAITYSVYGYHFRKVFKEVL